MNKAELIAAVQEKAGIASKAQAQRDIDAFFAVLNDALLAGDPVSIVGFGSFKLVSRAARKGRNPKTGKEIDIPASKTVKFTPSKALKEGLK